MVGVGYHGLSDLLATFDICPHPRVPQFATGPQGTAEWSTHDSLCPKVAQLVMERAWADPLVHGGPGPGARGPVGARSQVRRR